MLSLKFNKEGKYVLYKGQLSGKKKPFYLSILRVLCFFIIY